MYSPVHTAQSTQYDSDIKAAVERLQSGLLVAFPTETVYGLGADASNLEALARLYALKGRPDNHPVIVHLARAEQMTDWAVDIPEVAWQLAKAFWPGPMTLILKKAPAVLPQVTGGQDTVGIRIPSHSVAQTLLSVFGRGVAAPSANRFGHISPTSAEHVRQDFPNAELMVLDGPACEVGLESTIIDCTPVDATGQGVRILRPGGITPSQLTQVIGVSVEGLGVKNAAPVVPGSLTRHYAPQIPLRVIPVSEITDRVTMLMTQGKSPVVLSWSETLILPSEVMIFSMPNRAPDYARCLYETLRQAETSGCDIIVVETPPQDESWAAVCDRLMRSAAQS